MGSKRPAASDVAAFDAVENGVISLFSARVLDIFGGWPLLDLALVCLGGLVVKRALGGLRSHVMETLEGVVKGIVLKITLEAMSDKDLAAHAAHLLCAFLLLHAFDAGGLGSAAKYVFASQVAKAFASDQFLGAVLCVALQANMPALAATPRLQARPRGTRALGGARG